MSILSKAVKQAFVVSVALSSLHLSAADLSAIQALQNSANGSNLKLRFNSAVGKPNVFTMRNGTMIVFDFPGAGNAMSSRRQVFNGGLLKNVQVGASGNKLRVMANTARASAYNVAVQGSDVVVSLKPGQAHATPLAQRTSHSGQAQQRQAQQRQAQARQQAQHRARAAQRPAARSGGGRMLGTIDFRSTGSGNGKLLIPLPHPATEVVDSRAGNNLILKIKNVDSRQVGKRINVMDFATQANSINVSEQSGDTIVKVNNRGGFDHKLVRKGNMLEVHVNRVVQKQTGRSPYAPKSKHFTGKPLSMNFQDIEIRSVLQLLADFTGKNIIVSDSVKGNVTLRLKNVPWDQALDIILETKQLGMRKNGNVIWVAPQKELDAKEARELEAMQRKMKLEPLVTEYIPVNFAKVEEILGHVRPNNSSSEKGQGNGLISDRGSVSADVRTNTILVRDTQDRVNSIRNTIKSLDIPIRQVAVETRVVIAGDNFSKDLGAKFGASRVAEVPHDEYPELTKTVPVQGGSFETNLPNAVASASTLGFQVLNKNFLLDLELSALQAEDKGEIISTPKVLTANKKRALIEQGIEIPYLTQSEGGGTTVEFKKAVLSLEVTPQITPESQVIMDLKVNQDTVGKVYNGIPSIYTREIQTQVLVDNGQTVVLGGVHERTKRNAVSKVPVLGDIPYIGRIFTSTSKIDEKNELLVFITPKIQQ